MKCSDDAEALFEDRRICHTEYIIGLVHYFPHNVCAISKIVFTRTHHTALMPVNGKGKGEGGKNKEDNEVDRYLSAGPTPISKCRYNTHTLMK